ARRRAGAAVGPRRVRAPPRHARLRVHGRNEQRRVSAVPARAGLTRSQARPAKAADSAVPTRRGEGPFKPPMSRRAFYDRRQSFRLILPSALATVPGTYLTHWRESGPEAMPMAQLTAPSVGALAATLFF